MKALLSRYKNLEYVCTRENPNCIILEITSRCFERHFSWISLYFKMQDLNNSTIYQDFDICSSKILNFS